MPRVTGRDHVGLLMGLGLTTLFTASFLFSCARASAPPERVGRDGPLLRVNLSGAPWTVRVAGAWSARDEESGAPLGQGAALEGRVTADPEGIRVGGTCFPARRVRISPRQEGLLQVNRVAYWGDLLLLGGDGTLAARNLVRMEPYLAGVLGSELVRGWPEETLKAQAVAARTYALVCREKRAAEAFDLTDDVMDQKYEGRLKETPETRRLAGETAGEVLTWRRRPFEAYYSSVCGGHTGDVVRALNRGPWIPPLAGRPCPYCAKGLPPEKQGYHRWRKAVPRGDLEKALGVPGLVSLFPLGKDAGGHASRVRLAWAGDGGREMEMLPFRRTAGLLSNCWTAELSPEQVVFDGRGFGHGVGLCQWGAKRMGEKGFDHREILRFYYPGADLERQY